MAYLENKSLLLLYEMETGWVARDNLSETIFTCLQRRTRTQQ